MKVQTTIKTGGKGKKGGGAESRQKKAKPAQKTRETVYWCIWKGVERDTVDELSGERVRHFDGTQWGTWIIAPEGETNGRLEHLAWYSTASHMMKPDPRPRRVTTRVHPGNDGTVIVDSLDEGNDPFVVDSFVALSVQEAQERIHLDSIHQLGYRDQMSGIPRYAMSGITNLLVNYPLKTAHLRMDPKSFAIPSSDSEGDSDDSESDSDDDIFGEEKKKKKVNA